MHHSKLALHTSIKLLSATIFGLGFAAPAIACDQWVMPAKLFVEQNNNSYVAIDVTPAEGGFAGTVIGRAQYNEDDVRIIPTGLVDGTMEGSTLNFTVRWSTIATDIGNSTGVYTGTVGPQGRVTGTTYDRDHPETTATWYTSQVLQCRSPAATTTSSQPTVGFARVKPLPGSAPAPVRSICEMARSARARGSPAAPGLERQCAAQAPPASVGFARIKVPPPSAPAGVGFGRVNVQTPPAGVGFARIKVDGNADTRSICEMAADARARNSPAASGLERQCAQSPAAAAAANAGSAAQAEMEGTSGDIRLSRVYTAGGSNGATTDDFVELRNRGQTPLDLSGWSLQYASPQGTTWQVIPLSGTIAPDRIFLISSGRLQFGSAVVPPDWAAPIQLGANAGKLALIRSTRPLDGACPVDSAAVVDFLGYGTANCSLENVPPPGPPDAAFVRLQDGCADTRDNGTDFTVGPATALDRARTIAVCP